MEPRIDYAKVSPGGLQAMLSMSAYVRQSGLENSLLQLVYVRASQINGCAYCLDMHTKDARLAGEDEMRLYTLSAWRETSFFTEREQAALAWTETVTLVSVDHVPEDVYAQARSHFTEKELVDLTFAIILINGWNRLGVPFRLVPGKYQAKPA